ncbi:hypothetical protein AMTR_s00057p00105740 [Amborella trichopoda]|uniref:Uncharacterized protein n=1 Tax=Amborella trichopoda TaxID=13333 RepID=U5CU42_AMBTC|nr:hypothetical protein AMTR_s00057p00105740 [Amborella trichopoda]
MGVSWLVILLKSYFCCVVMASLDLDGTLVAYRRPSEESDGEYYRDISSDGSSDFEVERGLKYERPHHLTSKSNVVQMDRLSLGDNNEQNLCQEGFSSDDGEGCSSQGGIVFEFFEQDPPYCREPLADKISDLACQFPDLLTLRSCDLLPASWISVAWYPIYRIPTGPTLQDLDACFLTYHSLSTPFKCLPGAQGQSWNSNIDRPLKLSLPSFGLASYKFKLSVWTPNGVCERQLASSLLQAADNWIRLLQVEHPDFRFFISHSTHWR